MKRLDLPQVTLDLRHTGGLLAHPCPCGRDACTLGEHIWFSTQDMRPGLRAQTTDPRTRSWPIETDDGTEDHSDRTDPTQNVHLEYRRRLVRVWRTVRDLQQFMDAHRPDRTVPLPEPPADEVWCRPCLTIGVCEPRHRGDECRWHYEFRRTHHIDAPVDLTRAKHDGKRITERMVDDAVREAKLAAKAQRRRRRKAG